MSAKTDSGCAVQYEELSPGVRNLLTLYGVFSRESAEVVQERFAGRGYGELKKQLAEVTIEALAPIQAKYRDLIKDPGHLEGILTEGAARASQVAEATLSEVRVCTGL